MWTVAQTGKLTNSTAGAQQAPRALKCTVLGWVPVGDPKEDSQGKHGARGSESAFVVLACGQERVQEETSGAEQNWQL